MKVILSNIANLKMKYYIDLIDFEISGVGLVEKLPNKDLYVVDLFLIKQVVSAAETKLDSKAVQDFMIEKMKDETFPMEKLRLWWHSHVNMGVFWSGTDKATMNALDLDLPEDNWFLSIVGNKQGLRKARVDIYAPFRMNVDDLEVVVGEDLELEAQIEAEIQEKVSIERAIIKSQPIYGPGGQIINGKKDDEEPENYSLSGASHAFAKEDEEENDGYDPTKSKRWNKRHRKH